MSDHDLIRRGDALAAIEDLFITADNDREEGYDEGVGASLEAIAALPPAKQDDLASGKAVTVGVNLQLVKDCRDAMNGEGPRAYDWSDKPHRLIYDLCREIERLSALKGK